MGEVVELHTCPIEGCGAQIKRHLLMCRQHWRMVPRDVSKDVLRTWDAFRTTRNRDERRLALQAYTLARAQAIRAVNDKVLGNVTRPPERAGDSCVPCDVEAPI